MKVYTNIITVIAVAVLLFTTQSCFQDLDNDPPFNYPQEEPEPEPEPSVNEPLKLHFKFENNLDDSSNYMFRTTATGNISYSTGINGQAYKGNSDKTYFLIESHPNIASSVNSQIKNLGEFTVAFWMNSENITNATSIFSITNTEEFWSNLDIFFDGDATEGQGFLKVHLLNYREGKDERWFETRIPDMMNKWTHIAVTYNSSTSMLILYVNGIQSGQGDWSGCGSIVFDHLGPMIMGTLPFQADPSLTSQSSGEDWAGYYSGLLDEFRFYSETLSASEINNLYNTKE